MFIKKIFRGASLKLEFAECVFVTWTIIILVSIIPKTLSELDMVFLYFVDTILVISTYTVLNLNLGYLTSSPNFEKAFGVMVYRIIAIPLVLMISANIFRYRTTKLAGLGIQVMIILVLLLFEQVIRQMHMITFAHWNLFESALVFAGFIVFSNCMAWWIVQAGEEKIRQV